MERAKYIRCLRPTILLSILIFILTIFMPVDDANCETDRAFIEINSKNTGGPVIVPNLDYGEPGSSPWGRLYLTDYDNDSFDPEVKHNIEMLPRTKMKYYSFFMLYMLNQILYGK